MQKKILFFLLPVLICSISGLSQFNNRLSISHTGPGSLQVQMDNKRITLYDRISTLYNLTPGDHTLVIYQLQKTDGGGNSNYRYKEVYNGTLTIKDQYHLEIGVMRFGKVVWDERKLDFDDWGDGIGGNEPSGKKEETRTMNETEFRQMIDLIKKDVGFSSDENAVATAKAVIPKNKYSLDQVRQICKLFPLDKSKLVIAKLCYDYCINQNNYYLLGDVFDGWSTGSQTKKEFMEFLATKN